MTVLQIVKALAAEEDINWGDSDTTFSRQTRTGSTTSVHYVDSKSIPANSLGGVIEDHLHEQNTDTGTTETTFKVNSGGNILTLSSAGLSTSRAFTFPNTQTTQALVGATDLAATGASQGASLVGVRDNAGYFTGTNVETVLAELYLGIYSLLLPYGYKRGLDLSYINASNISLTRGIWHHSGTTDQMVYSMGSITYTPSGLSGSQMQFMYLDDSAIASAGSQIITGTQLTNSTTAPAFSNTKFGWYNGNDRCIGAFQVISGSILPFLITSDNFMLFRTGVSVFSDTCPTTGSEAALDFSDYVPPFATKVRILANLATDANSISFFIDNVSSTVSTKATTSQASEGLTLEPYLNTSQVAYWSCEAADAGSITLLGYYIGDL